MSVDLSQFDSINYDVLKQYLPDKSRIIKDLLDSLPDDCDWDNFVIDV